MKLPDYIIRSYASFSDDRQYRYFLERYWDKEKGVFKLLNFVMLNPSTADLLTDDNSVRKCTVIARRLGYSGVRILNLFAIRSTDPKVLYENEYPIGERNYYWIKETTRHSDVVIAWGNHGLHQNRYSEVLDILRENHCNIYMLDMNKTGMPKHPLYIRNDSELKLYRG